MDGKTAIVSQLKTMRAALRLHAEDDAMVAYIRETIDGLLDAYNAAAPEFCCVCGSAAVAYHNYREQPFCCVCAACCPSVTRGEA